MHLGDQEGGKGLPRPWPPRKHGPRAGLFTEESTGFEHTQVLRGKVLIWENHTLWRKNIPSAHRTHPTPCGLEVFPGLSAVF